MASICIFNSVYRDSAKRWIEIEDVNIHTLKMDYNNKPYILFEHKDYPLGALRADFKDNNWYCDLD
jgi:hypothetical protein